MQDSPYSEDLKLVVSFATENGAILSIKLLTYQLDFGHWVMQMHSGDGVIEVLSSSFSVREILKNYANYKKIMGQKNIEYKRMLFGLAGGKLEVKCSDMEDFSVTAMRLVQTFVREL